MRYYASRGNAPFGETACVIYVYHILYYKDKSKKKKCHKNAQPYRGRAARAQGRTTPHDARGTLPHPNQPTTPL